MRTIRAASAFGRSISASRPATPASSGISPMPRRAYSRRSSGETIPAESQGPQATEIARYGKLMRPLAAQRHYGGYISFACEWPRGRVVIARVVTKRAIVLK